MVIVNTRFDESVVVLFHSLQAYIGYVLTRLNSKAGELFIVLRNDLNFASVIQLRSERLSLVSYLQPCAMASKFSLVMMLLLPLIVFCNGLQAYIGYIGALFKI